MVCPPCPRGEPSGDALETLSWFAPPSAGHGRSNRPAASAGRLPGAELAPHAKWIPVDHALRLAIDERGPNLSTVLMSSLKNHSIVVPTDFSAGAQAAMALAIDFGVCVGGRMELIHVYPIAPYLGSGPITMVSPLLPPAPEVLAGVQRQLEDLAEQARRVGVECHTAALEGDAATTIVTHATTVDAGLIVMGTHGRTGWRRALLGSVAEQVLRHASCPVVVVPIRKE